MTMRREEYIKNSLDSQKMTPLYIYRYSNRAEKYLTMYLLSGGVRPRKETEEGDR